MLKFNLLLWAFFSALFGSVMAAIGAPLWIGYASAAALVWGYDIAAGAFFRWKDRDIREAEIRAQTEIMNANMVYLRSVERYQEAEHEYQEPRRAAE